MKTLAVIFLSMACSFCVAQTSSGSTTPEHELSASAHFPDAPSEVFVATCARVDHPTDIQKEQAIACGYYMTGMAQGIVKALGIAKLYGPDPNIHLCIPAATGSGQLVEDVVTYIKKNPQIKATGSYMAFLALLAKYSCLANEPKDKPSQP